MESGSNGEGSENTETDKSCPCIFRRKERKIKWARKHTLTDFDWALTNHGVLAGLPKDPSITGLFMKT
jgi:hypothetical protein